ncbi:GNAT family N-acetyltransferase (plasmid) [Agrobacterium vaccinii]|uniref:GNAT family N-acetyltransferase n=1 Tax=Agrobacterium TaxID=357 RepID=UPI001E354695|nr:MULTISPECIES: GNAT family N-acetyltransferase [Agrobacterium]UHS59646.1 GNAT family N-acetyltransferase [Agrobacterium vaccinii]UHS64497.1 GNAT family N-acetyltransferase [Agrobacterium vaccinii]
MLINDLSLEWLNDEAQSAVRAEARTFCLRMIKNVYGIDYTPAWHSDLDSLLSAQPDNWFSRERQGSFLVVRDGDGHIIAAGGLYAIENKPSTKERLRHRYSDGEKVCQIVRVYLDSSVRRKGLGTKIVAALESRASEFKYTSSYLHADAQTPETLGFWKSQGYGAFGQFSYPSNRGTETSVDFDKPLRSER